MPDKIGDYFCLNKLERPATHAWILQPITREYVDGDAWQRIARRAKLTQHPCVFLCVNAAAAQSFSDALYALQGTAGLTMVADGREYDEIVVVQVDEIRIRPIQRRTVGVQYDGTTLAGGAGGRLVTATVTVGRSNAPPELESEP